MGILRNRVGHMTYALIIINVDEPSRLIDTPTAEGRGEKGRSSQKLWVSDGSWSLKDRLYPCLLSVE